MEKMQIPKHKTKDLKGDEKIVFDHVLSELMKATGPVKGTEQANVLENTKRLVDLGIVRVACDTSSDKNNHIFCLEIYDVCINEYRKVGTPIIYNTEAK